MSDDRAITRRLDRIERELAALRNRTVNIPVRIAPPGASGAGGLLEIVSLTSDGGSAGDLTTACSFTYAFTASDGAHSAVSPDQQRSAKGKMMAATRGLWDSENEQLYLFDEVPDRGCGPGCT